MPLIDVLTWLLVVASIMSFAFLAFRILVSELGIETRLIVIAAGVLALLATVEFVDEAVIGYGHAPSLKTVGIGAFVGIIVMFVVALVVDD